MTNEENHGVLPPIPQRQPRPVTRKRREPPTQFLQPSGEEGQRLPRRESDIRDSSPRTSLLWNRRQDSCRHVLSRRPETRDTNFRPRTAKYTAANKGSPQRTEEKSSKRTSPPRKNGPNSSPRRGDGNPEVIQRTNVTLRLPRIQTARHKNRKMRNFENGDIKHTNIVISDSNVAIKGHQTINRERQRGPTKQRKFLKDVRTRREVLEEETLAMLEEEKDYLLDFIPTRAYTNSREILNREKFLLIRSKPGEGCSSIALKLLHDFKEANHPKTPLQVTEVTDFDEAIGGKNTAVFIDDLFSLDMVSLEHKKEWIEKLQRLASALQVKSRNNCVIITMREDAYERLPNFLRDSKLFKAALIDISHENNNLTSQEKMDFLDRYVLPCSPLPLSQSTKLLRVSLPFGFPKCCEIFQDNPSLHKSPFDFFRDPQIFIQGELEIILSEEPPRLAPLALVLLCNGAISENQLHKIAKKGHDALWDTLEEHYENLMCERKQLKVFAHDARKTFLQFDRNTNRFTFTHPCIQRAMACLLGRLDLKPVIKHCDLSLLPQMRTKSDLCRSKDEVLLDGRCFKTLSKQICKTMSKRDKVNFGLLSKMSVWEERKFVVFFGNFLTQNAKEEIFSSQDISNKLLIEYAMQNDKHKSVENMLFVAGKTGQSKCWLDIACENNQRLARKLLQNNIQPDFETIQFGIKGKNASILRTTFDHVGMNFDRFARRRSKVAHDFSSDVTIADEACLSGDVDVVRAVTEYFPELVNSRKETSFLVLIKAAITGGICEIVNKMVELGVNGSSFNQDYQGQKNQIVFSIACKYGETEVAKYFGSGDYTLFTSRDKNNHTPLHSAAIGGTKELAEYLIKGGADPFAVTVKQATALHLSCASGNLDIVTLLVDNYPTLIEMEDKKEATPLHYATRGGSIEILTLLIEKQANIAKVTRKGESILHVSCHRGYIEIAKFVTEKCPELSSATTKDGKTALHFACTTDDLDLVKFLVEDLHLNPLQKTNAGDTSLQMATGYEVKNYLQSICPARKSSCNSRIGPNVFESVI